MRSFTSKQPADLKNSLLGVVRIENIKFDPKCNHEITKILRGLQEIYCNEALRKNIEDVLVKFIPKSTKLDKGRRGMDLWTIFVLGMLRFGCNLDYDALKSALDDRMSVRKMCGFDLLLDQQVFYNRQTIYDNVKLFTKEIADEINLLIINHGHTVLGVQDTPLETRCDSYVFLTNVHFPTDFSLLRDSLNKLIDRCYKLATKNKQPGWREYESRKTKVDKAYKVLSRIRHSTSKDEAVILKRHEQIVDQIQTIFEDANSLLEKAEELQQYLPERDKKIDLYVDYSKVFMNQIKRRMIEGEKIPADEKIFSIFEPYTEWISKGKAGVAFQLGVRISVVDDQYGFILNYRIMKNQTDQKVPYDICKEVKSIFNNVASMSFDKGYHTTKDDNGKTARQRIEEDLDMKAYIPVKGRGTKKDRERESRDDFKKARRRHSGIESTINALQKHGLDRCPDHGEKHYDRYVALAICSFNIQKLGAYLLSQDLSASNKKVA